nr:MAG TPA: hypothetical protein [Caudoviricetes sp.]
MIEEATVRIRIIVLYLAPSLGFFVAEIKTTTPLLEYKTKS